MAKFKFATQISILLFLIATFGSSALAQFSSGIEGTVRDSSGAVIPGAKVTVTNSSLAWPEPPRRTREATFASGTLRQPPIQCKSKGSASEPGSRKVLPFRYGSSEPFPLYSSWDQYRHE